MKITVRYFASVREALGQDEAVELPARPDGWTAGAARDWLAARGGRHAEVLARPRALRAAVNQVMAQDSMPLRDGDELALFPPVTGG